MNRSADDGGTLEALPDAALFIDWENIKFSLTNRGMTPSIAALLDACERYGRVVFARAYADWQEPPLIADPTALYVAGIEPVYVPVRRYREEAGPSTVKNSVDVRIAVDAIELVHTHPQIEVFVLASGDQDFLHVVNRLRPYGKHVVGLSVSWTASPRLVERVDHMIFYDREVEPSEHRAESSLEEEQLQKVAESFAAGEKLEPSQVYEAVLAVSRKVSEYRSGGREISISGLGTELQQILGSLTFRMVVRGRLQRLTREMERHGALQIVSRGVDDWLYVVGEDAAGISEDSAREHRIGQGLPQLRTARWSFSWTEVPIPDQNAAIQLVDTLSRDPALDYLTFNRIAEAVDGSSLGPRWNGRQLVNAMVAAGVLAQEKERQWYDAFTGKTGTFWSLELNRTNERVASALAAIRNE